MKRLWTVYEIASFLIVNRDAPIVIMPESMPKIVIVGSQAWFFFSLVSHLSYHEAVELSGIGGNTFLLGAVAVIVVPSVLKFSNVYRDIVLEHGQLHNTVGRFRFAEADCVVESDRALVQGNIVSMALVEPARPKQYPMGVYPDFLSVCVAYSSLLGSLVAGTSILMLRSAQLLVLVLY